MFGLEAIDAAVLVVYLVGITFLGIWAARRVKGSADFFMPRRFGKGMLTAHAFGTGTHSDQAVSVASKTYTNGLSGIWYQWLWLFCTPFYWLVAPLMRRFRAVTMADVFDARFGRSVSVLFALVGTLNLTFNIGVMLKGSGAVVASCFGGGVDPDSVILVMTAMFVVYGVAGGLSAAIVTDFVQGILTVIFSFALLPFALEAVGGLGGLRGAISDPEMFSLVAPSEIGLFYVAIIALNGLVGIATQPHTMGNCASGRTESDGRFGFMVGNFVKRICTMAWCLTGLAAVGYLGAGVVDDPDAVYGIMARDFLPRVMPGLLGVFLASLLASVMSSCDSFMVASSALFTENLYRPLFPGKPPGHYLRVGRIAALAVVVGGLFFAYRLEGVIEGLEIFWKISPMMGIAFWMGVFWRRATTAGAWAATLGGFGMWFITAQPWFVSALSSLSVCDSLGLISGDEVYLPWQMIMYLSVAVVAGVTVSLLTRPEPEDKLDRFYEVSRTPVAADEEIVVSCQLPAGVTPAPRRLLFGRFGLEIPIPSKSSVTGFLAGWVLVALMLGGFWWLVN